jgi:N,N'-diacetyllegionaminate synthase
MSVYIIAEAGDNHNGDFHLALKLIDVAVGSGADCVKFQTFVTEEVISRRAKKAEYQKASTGSDESQFEMVKKLELSFKDFQDLNAYCQSKRIQFLSTPFDLPSIAFLDTLDMPFWKIPSGEVTNLPYLLAIAKTKKPVVMSTGMCEMTEIKAAMEVLRANGTPKITLLHCNTEYPTPFEDVNLRAMLTMKEHFGVDVGYSDHTKGIEVPIAAVAMGATIIEKHFTLDRNMQGPDHKASLEPQELADMVKSIRNIEKSLGNGVKVPSPSERKNIEIARKSIVARCTIKKGDFLTEKNITTKRPGNGISPMRWFEVLGTKAIHDFGEDDLIEI